MPATKSAMKMPEFLIFGKMFAIGFVVAEVLRVSFYLGTEFANEMQQVALWLPVVSVVVGLALCFTYLVQRNVHLIAARIGHSYRIDLLVAVGIGVWSNKLISPWLESFHAVFKMADPHWAPAILIMTSLVLLSPIIQQYFPRPKKQAPQLYFVADEEISDDNDDLLASDTQAKAFAETVLSSGAHPGLIFGVDGPWGVGKTSFINLAQRYWESAVDKVIICRFEPLRYASEPDLADRLIHDLSAAIQNTVFAPEFRPAATRYSRMIRGKADVSFLGFKLSLEPSKETIDELLDDIDEVLRRIGHRAIIVIDDLDRLDAKTMNNVLFATRRALKLSQATYILCYDTEILAGNREEGARAREFLEKFVTVKLSLFVDSSSLRDFLRHDWERDEGELSLVPSDTMVKIGAVLNELADILDGDMAAYYLPLVGNMRKLKRFLNAILLMQIEKTDLGRTDFNKRDLINLMLLHLNYPGVFRRIYAEETEGRSGTFSLRREYGEPEYTNEERFSQLQDEYEESAWFLLAQLFDVNTLEIGSGISDESVLRSRACFNSGNIRNLEAYLKLIVRFAAPEPQETYILYQNAVDQFRNGTSIASLLTSSSFALPHGEQAHDQFWRVLVNQSHDFTSTQAEDAIRSLMEYLPNYSAFENDDRGLRQRSIYTLIRLLDRAGWGRTSGRRLPNSANNVVEIAWRLFGENSFRGRGLLDELVAPDRGVLGWSDIMLLRLQCSADRQGQLHNVYSALIVDQNADAATTGRVNDLALLGMRKLSQEVFRKFKRTYIDTRLNFLHEANNVPIEAFLGTAFSNLIEEASRDPQSENLSNTIAQRIATARTVVKSFVIYQLSNSYPPTGSGVGCGYYDEHGTADNGGISSVMNDYLLGFCFNPEIEEENGLLFLDHCLAHLSDPFFSDRDEASYIATTAELPGGLNPVAMGCFWRQHGERIRELNLRAENRSVFTSNYIALYNEDLDGVFAVLDELAEVSSTPEPECAD